MKHRFVFWWLNVGSANKKGSTVYNFNKNLYVDVLEIDFSICGKKDIHGSESHY